MFILLAGVPSWAAATGLSQCLARGEQREHRLDREASLRLCFDQHKGALTKELCFQHVAKSRTASASTTLSEELKAVCFYETSGFAAIRECLKDSGRFRAAGHHDEAVFYCFQMFQDKLTRKECLLTAKNMIFPAKKNYLSQHCNEVGD